MDFKNMYYSVFHKKPEYDKRTDPDMFNKIDVQFVASCVVFFVIGYYIGTI